MRTRRRRRLDAALLAAAVALRAGDGARAARALPAPTFRPGGARSVARLGDLGPLPQAAIASAMLQREVARLDAEGRWLAGRPVDASGNTISWKQQMTSPMPMTLDIEVTAEGDTLTGTVGAGAFGSFPLSGTRTA